MFLPFERLAGYIRELRTLYCGSIPIVLNTQLWQSCELRPVTKEVNTDMLPSTVHGKIWWGKNWWILANRKLFVKIFIINIHRYTKMHLAYALTVVYLLNFSSPIVITCMVHQNFPPLNISHVQYLLLNVNKVLNFTSCFINISAACLMLSFT